MALLSQLIRRGTVSLLRLGFRYQEPGCRVTCYSRAVRTLSPYIIVVLFLAVPVSVIPVSAQDFTDELWEANRDIYDAILEHQFLTGLQDGTLPREAFIFYLVQDTHYLEAFARALRVTAAKAPRHKWRELLNTHAVGALSNELTLHNRLFKEHGVPQSIQEGMELAPEAFAYTSFLIATAHTGTFAEAIAALLPCYWIYWEVASELKIRGSANPSYQQWIEGYADPTYGEIVRTMLAMVNTLAAEASEAEREQMKAHHRRSSRYEWMFWDSAYHRRGWPP